MRKLLYIPVVLLGLLLILLLMLMVFCDGVGLRRAGQRFEDWGAYLSRVGQELIDWI